MQFNSVHFVVFFAAVFLIYWAIGSARRNLQNAWLLLANTVFYAYWDYRFLALLWIATGVDYFVGRGLARFQNRAPRRILLGISLAVNLGALGYFKYANFFLDSLQKVLNGFGWQADSHTLSVILPLGISFYTFQRLSYIIEVYRGQIKSTRNALAFWTFSSFFPCISAGPIERGSHLLPQFEKARKFDAAKSADALRQILWGLFKKIVIADNLAAPVNRAFSDGAALTGIDLGAAAFLYAIQIYADFSGYSDIAIGCGRLLGFSIRRNFSYPYFSRDIGEFWRRWHISMSSWFRDYIYTPLAFKLSLNQRWLRMACIMVTFGASGLWHGANWTFVVWGLLNGLYFAPLILGHAPEHGRSIVAAGKIFPGLRDATRVIGTFIVVCLSWIVFRADSLADAAQYFADMFSRTWLACPEPLWAVLSGIALLIYEWFTRERSHGLAFADIPRAVRWIIYMVCLLSILVLGNFGAIGFFYVQF